MRMAYEVPVGEGKTSGTISVRGFKREPVQGICLEVKGGELEINGVRHDVKGHMAALSNPVILA
ncbi:hypothetical protein SRB17_85190 [Streptomyces sp. RB17]|nr:hypothetical protein [Streptomyces sp. RB17]